jgi:hypothetical protein
MTAGKNWSTALRAYRPIGGGVMLTEMSAWRRRTPFICTDEQASSVPLEAFDLHGLHRWLASAPAALTLHLVLEVGGGQPSQAWLGLSAVGASEPHVRAQLASASAELGEALDAWALYTDIPSTPPDYPSAGRKLCAAAAASLTKPSPYAAPPPELLLQALTILDRRASPLTLCIDIPAGGIPAGLVDEIERAYKHASRRMTSHDTHIMAMLSGIRPEGMALIAHAQSLWSGLIGQQVRLHLHGSIPGSLLLQPLLDALEVLLGVDLTLSSEEAEIGPATPGIDLDPQGLLGTITIGASKVVSRPPARRADDIPF